jgi:hypothetical protein
VVIISAAPHHIQEEEHMKKRIGTGLAALVAGSALMLTAPAFAQGHPQPFKHGHIMLIGADPVEMTYRKCVDLAGGNALRLNAHHAHIHTGRAGQALEKAGNFVIPTEDILPEELQGTGMLPANCAGVDAWLANMG